MPHRATRDADLLDFGPGDKETVAKLFRDSAAVAVDDGIVFDPSTVSVQDLRKEAGYGGVRVLLTGTLARARCPTQVDVDVDVGFGDAVTPAPVEAIYPVLLSDMPAPRLRTYPACTVVAEKLHAIAVLGMTNSRLKDYLDLSVLLEREALDPVVLAAAVAATFSRRGTVLPATLPAGLSEEFAHDASRNALWRAFLKRNELIAPPLAEVVAQLHLALWPALTEAAALAGLPQPDTPN